MNGVGVGRARPQIELFHSEGDDTPIASSSTPVDVVGSCGGEAEAAAEGRLDLTDVSLWSAEQPTLYVVVITLRDKFNRTLDCESTRIGFRSVQTRDKRLLVNGQNIMIAGVNRHEHCPDNGKAITEQSMVQDILLLKRNNFNAVGAQPTPKRERGFSLWFVGVGCGQSYPRVIAGTRERSESSPRPSFDQYAAFSSRRFVTRCGVCV